MSDISNIEYSRSPSLLSSTPRSLGRNSIARTIYHRMMEDESHQNDRHEYWYSVNENKLSDDIRAKFIRFHQDVDTEAFLQNCYEKSEWVFTQIFHTVVRSVLGWFMTSTSINGYLERGSMFIFSNDQFRKLMGITDQWRGDNLLDLGAGDGKVTHIMGKHYHNVFATEASPTMVNRLKEKGFSILGVNDWSNRGPEYDLIGCLNLLDRCDRPMSILHSMRTSLNPETGRVLVAIVLPFSTYVETGSKDNQPSESLPIPDGSFEDQVNSLVHNVFEPAGYELEKFTRLPYLCEGDLQKSFYVLDDAVFVLKAKS